MWNGDYTRYALLDKEEAAIFVAGFDTEPFSVIWDVDIGRYRADEGDTGGGTRLPERQIAGSFEQVLLMYWRGEQLYIDIGEDFEHRTTYQWESETNTLVEAEPPAGYPPLRLQSQDVTSETGGWRLQWNLTILDPDTGDVLSYHEDVPEPDAATCDGDVCRWFVSASHRSRRFVAVTTQGGIQFWSLEDGSLLHTVPTERDIASLAWDTEGRRLAAGSMDGTVYIFAIP